MQRRFAQVDVFTTEPYRGNPVAVVIDGDALEDEQMRRFANWTNLSETTFVLPPSDPAADYRVRIFTPSGELPFAGHPTLGTCHAWLSANGRDGQAPGATIVQECAVGLVDVRSSPTGLAFAAPPLIRSGPVDDADLAGALRALGIPRTDVVDAVWADNGPGWMAILLRDAEAVLRARAAEPSDRKIGLVGAHPAAGGTAGEVAVEVRAFYPFDSGSLGEDPVTGSLNASIAQWLLGTGRLTAPYVAAQGTAMGRRGRVHVDTADDGRIWVGGGTVTCVDGTVTI